MLNREIIARFSEYLRANGLRSSQQRICILETFLTMAPHLTAEELHQQVARRDASIGLSTVYRTLRLLCDAGLAKQRHFHEGRSCYEQSVDHAHHDHLICVVCGKIVEFICQEIEDLQEEMATRHGFTLVRHRLDMYGHCADCRREQATAAVASETL